MIEEEWMLLIEINKVVEEEEDLKIYSPCLEEGEGQNREDLLKLKLS